MGTYDMSVGYLMNTVMQECITCPCEPLEGRIEHGIHVTMVKLRFKNIRIDIILTIYSIKIGKYQT